MNVTLISYTQDARELLLFTKQTRLTQDAALLQEIKEWPEERKAKELTYMLGTIQSSWEFVDYIFYISGVSRAFTHQFVRTREGELGDDELYTGPRHKRLGSYAQQSQRTVDMTGAGFVMPQAVQWPLNAEMRDFAGSIGEKYTEFLERGVKPQDARAILPTNVATSITAKFNLRTLSEMAKLRLCTRTQGEYQDVFRAMRLAIIKVHPWAEPFIRVHCAATGVCCFPNYAECPIKPGIFDPDTGKVWPYPDGSVDVAPWTRQEIQILWERTKFEATPKGDQK